MGRRKREEMVKQHAPVRRIVTWASWLVLWSATAIGADQADRSKVDRPNIVWISLEDITPMLGCYGDQYARTPVFDALAGGGIRYTQAHSIAAVCSTSRSSVITGMYPSSLGTHHHRSNVGKPPAFVKMLPNLLREAGYYTTNNAKKDYNIAGDRWHESSKQAHWRNRRDSRQPFFAVFNYGACHSSITKISEDVIVKQRLNRLQPSDFHDPAKVSIPPYHPDIPEFRQAWARYYDAVTQVDYQAGDIFSQLKEDGLWEETIIFVWADHGVGMPRGKHTAWEQGTHVPLIVRFPERYQHLAPASPGAVIDGLVTLMDLGPSTLAMAGLKTPNWMHGEPLLCRLDESESPYRDFVIGMRDRLDSRYEMVRSVRDERFRYQRNFYPQLPFKPYEDYEFNAPILKKWVELARQGKLTGPQAMLNLRFKPIEELYDSAHDPHMVNNVVDDPQYAEVVKTMRTRLHDWMLETRDLGLLEETEVLKRARAYDSHWELSQALDNYSQILKTANLQLQREAAIPALLASANASDAAVRFWAVLGLIVLRTDEDKVVAALKHATNDASVSVATTAADGLFNLGRYDEGVQAILSALKHPMLSARIRAAGILDTQPPTASKMLRAAIPVLQDTAAEISVSKMPGIPYGLNQPFERAIKALTGQESYYRW
ncbi:MAG: sulfatase-like hydrolase/transferase [Pirellulaceae bacterium]|nr:sulfatase-like hydrolase/transferase [Pirellulaceae bacterium]